MATEHKRARAQGIGEGKARIIFEGGVVFADASGIEYTFTIEEAQRRIAAQDWTPPAKGKEAK